MPDRNLVTCLLVCAAMSIAMVASTTQTGTLSITRVSVVDVADGRILPNRTVTITGDTIAKVAPDGASPAGAQVVDGQGKFLIPGLWDMHAHIQGTRRAWLPLYIANGVTGIRDMGADLDFILDIREATSSGRTLGPSDRGGRTDPRRCARGLAAQDPRQERRMTAGPRFSSSSAEAWI